MTGEAELGRIDCPYCGYKSGMRIKADKNGAPFGFCDANCDGQLRIGGKKRRVDAFLALHPDIAKKMRVDSAPPDHPSAENKADVSATENKPKNVNPLSELFGE